MLTALLSWAGILEIISLAPILIRRHRQKRLDKDILLYGASQATSIPFLDSQIQKHAGVELNWAQKRSHKFVVTTARKLVNTKAFELIMAAGLKKYWVLAIQQMNLKSGLNEDTKGLLV
jgi:hypothetical protein